MRKRDLARAIAISSFRAAQDTRAIRRGVVDSVGEDGRCVVTLPNGSKIRVASSSLYPPSDKQSVAMVRKGSQWEIITQSAYGGGTGSPYEAP